MVNDEDHDGDMIDNMSVAQRLSFNDKDNQEPTIWEKHAKETVQDFSSYGSMIEKKFQDSEPKPEPKPEPKEPKSIISHFRENENSPKPVIGHFRENELSQGQTENLVKATMVANGGNKANPSVQIELATDTRSKDGAIVTQVLENANTEAEEDAAINQIAG